MLKDIIFLDFNKIPLNDFKLLFRGSIYNKKEIADFLDSKVNLDDDIIAEKLFKYFIKSDSLSESIKKMDDLIDGDYSLAVEHDDHLVLFRNYVGMVPVYYLMDDDKFLFSFNKSSIPDSSTLEPGFILDLFKDNFSLNKLNLLPWEIYNESKMSENEIKTELKDLILKSFEKRLDDEIALPFSAGVDSAILASLLKESGVKTTLYTVANENSKDLKFSKLFAEENSMDIEIIDVDERSVRESFNQVLNAVGEFNIMKLGVGITMHLAFLKASEDGYNIAMTGSGSDELFGGYNRYLRNYNNLNNELRHDMANMANVNIERDYEIACLNDIEIRSPFLDKKLIEFALNIPDSYKIYGKDDNLRKRILRETAADLGVFPDIAMRPKKAAQYGSGVDKILTKKVLKKDENGKYYY